MVVQSCKKALDVVRKSFKCVHPHIQQLSVFPVHELSKNIVDIAARHFHLIDLDLLADPYNHVMSFFVVAHGSQCKDRDWGHILEMMGVG